MNYYRKISLWLHLGAWLVVLVLPTVFIYSTLGNNITQLGRYVFRILSYGAIFYLSYFWLVPKFFFQHKKAGYISISLLVIITIYLLVVPISDILFSKTQNEPALRRKTENTEKQSITPKSDYITFYLLNYSLTSLLVSALALGLRFSEKYASNERIRKDLEREKLYSELVILKDQMSPHFFFNTLNNIYSLIGTDDATAQSAVLRLSKMMRYLLYESDGGTSTLSSEIMFMNNYIDLMKIRLTPRIDLQVKFPDEKKEMNLPPFLFITFIENAFKHGIGFGDNSFISITLKVNGTNLVFNTENSRNSKTTQMQEPYSGIGLENIKRRLKLLYPDRHLLEISADEKKFKVNLSIQQANQYIEC